MNKKTISIYNAQRIANSNQQVANAIYNQNKVNKEISDNEIKSKNRVDISLEEYEKIKKELENLRYENKYLRNIFEKFELPSNEKILIETIERRSFFHPKRLKNVNYIYFETEKEFLI